MSKTKLTCLAVLAVVLVFLCGGVFTGYAFANGIQNTGVQKETSLGAAYNDCQNYLANYILGFQEKTGIGVAAGSALANVLQSAAQGKFGNDGFGTGSPLFAAIHEAYPQAGLGELTNIWGKIQDYITSGREGFRNKQTALLDQLRDYEQWRQSGLVQSQFVRIMGFPSHALRASIGSDVKYGEDALDRMHLIVLSEETVDAYQTGIQKPLQVPGVVAPTAVPR